MNTWRDRLGKTVSQAGLCLCLLFSTGTALASPDPQQALTGAWTSFEPDTRGITRLFIDVLEPEQFTVEVWSRCRPAECHWGRTRAWYQPGTSPHLFLSWQDTYTRKLQLITLLSNGQLQVMTHSRFRYGPNRTPSRYLEYFFKNS